MALRGVRALAGAVNEPIIHEYGQDEKLKALARLRRYDNS